MSETAPGQAAAETAPGDGIWVANPARDLGWTATPVSPQVGAFHRSLPGYAPTRLVDLPALAAGLGVARVFAKDESDRFGLPAFKALGASWAVHRCLDTRPVDGSHGPGGVPGAGEAVTFVTATDGNHGRAVARFARALGHRAAIVVPDGVHPVAVQAIRDEGAQVTHEPGSYDDAVAAAVRLAAGADDAILVQDMALPGFEDVPGWIVDGYTTLFGEVDEQLRAAGVDHPDLVVVPTGVGSLLQAAVTHYRSGADPGATCVVSVEPRSAACVLASVRAGRPVTVETSVTSMAGLNCGTVSTLAWPVVRPGLDGCVAVDDLEAARAGRTLAAVGVAAGPCGAASLAGAQALLTGAGATDRRATLRLPPHATVVLLVTEGAAANPA